MLIALLRFSHNKDQASYFMSAHNQWIAQGFEDKIFLVAGSLQPNLGGTIIAHGESREAFENRVSQDPFVANNIVTAEILDIAPKKIDDRLTFL